MFEDALLNIAFALVRIGGFMANGFLFGLPVVYLAVLGPTLLSLDLDARAQTRLARRLSGLVQSAFAASAVATLIAILLQAVVIADFAGGRFGMDSVSDVLDSSFGRWYLFRFPLLVALAVLLWGKVGDLARPAPSAVRSRSGFWITWIVLGLALLSTSSFSGHASVSDPEVLALFNDVVHLAAGSAWFVGIVVLASVVPDLTRFQAEEQKTRFTGSMIIRFSSLALIAIGLVAVTGTFNSLFNVADFNDLWTSGYGGLLLAKIGFFLVVLAMGGINHFYVRRRFERAQLNEVPESTIGLFRRTIAIELFLALAIFALTGALAGSARTQESSIGTSVVSPQA